MTSSFVCQKDFIKLISNRTGVLYNYCRYLVEHQTPERIMNRPFFGVTLSQSIQLEELLDSYGALNNQKWSKFRSLVATIKRFSEISYELIHIEYGIPGYRLLDVGHDFKGSTQAILEFSKRTIHRAAANFVSHCALLGVESEYTPLNDDNLIEQLPSGRLPYNQETRHVTDVGKIVTTLSTSFLNITADTTLRNIIKAEKPFDYASYMMSSVSEENLRTLELKFHNLQSLYDTYVSKTDTEILDKDLSILRGHISVVFHILTVATSLSHYYERHLGAVNEEDERFKQQMVHPVTLLAFIIDYCIEYMKLYIESTKKLCHDMLKRYSEIGEITVPVPRYRGFHVRPSTLIALIANHYGSELTMCLGNQKYNAAIPLDLFRANEMINSEKRKGLSREILKIDTIKSYSGKEEIRTVVHDVLLKLADKGKIMIYEQPLEISDCKNLSDLTIVEQVRSEVARLLAIGKIDIVTDLKIKFYGDKRVLEDIKLLAHYGYGEDNFGNNIPLPPRLAYLRK
jgi:hypothetical protein